jgi:malate dehydrogenase (quinone)
MSLVWGKENVDFLKKRYELLTQNPLIQDMIYTEDRDLMMEWMPLVMRGRKKSMPVAATRMDLGTDVNFGTLTRGMIARLEKMPGVTIHYNTKVRDLDPDGKGGWDIFDPRFTNQESEKRSEYKVCIHWCRWSNLASIKAGGDKERNGLWWFSSEWLVVKMFE